MRRFVLPLMIVLTAALFAPLPLMAATDPAQPAAQLEKAITEASERFERGALKPGAPFTVRLADGRSVTFSAEKFDADVDRAFELLETLLKQQKAAPAADSHLDSLMRAEKKTSAAAPAPRAAPPADYSVYGNYRKSRDERIEAQDEAAETDMQHVIAERLAADEDRARKMERDQGLQVQAMKWQSELDSQASASVKAAAAWEAEHSPAAYAKNFLGMVIQTAVGSFTGGFLGVVSTNLANKAVRSLYKDKDEAPPPHGGPGAPGPHGTTEAETEPAQPSGAPVPGTSSFKPQSARPGLGSSPKKANRADTTRKQVVY